MPIHNNSITVGAVTAIGATHLAVDLVGGGFGALLPTIAERMSLSSTAVGVLVALFSVSALGSQPFMGGLADRFGARHVTALAAVFAAALLAVAAVVTNLPLLIAVIVVGGLGSAAFHPAGAVLARRLGPDSPQNAVAVFAAAGTVGLALGPIAAITLAGDAAGSRILLLGVPALVIAPAIWWRSRGRDPSPTTTGERRSDAGALLRGEVATLAAAATMVAIVTTTVASTLPRWIADQPGRSAASPTIGWALATFSLAAAAGGLAAGYSSSRIDPARLLRLSLIAAMAPAGGLALVPPATLTSFVALALTGLLVGPALPLLLVAAQNAVPERAATASGIIMGLSHGLAGLVFVGVSVIIDVAGYRAGMLTGAAALLPAAIMIPAQRSVDDNALRKPAHSFAIACVCVVDTSCSTTPTTLAAA